jgi:hypothetical protein
MRHLLLFVLVTGCVVGSNTGGGGPGGDDQGGGDDGTTTPDAPGTQRVCSLEMTIPDAGNLAALKSQQCNVPGSGGAQKWYRLSATIAGTTDVVQLELWDGRGPFAAGAVAPGTYPIDTNFATCGVCLRALGDKGEATQKEYFAKSGSVEVTTVGGAGTTFQATITTATFGEVDANHTQVAGGCSSELARVQVAGTVVATGGGGGGGGGGGCPATVGD